MRNSKAHRLFTLSPVVNRAFARSVRVYLLACVAFIVAPDGGVSANDAFRIPIFVYHRFAGTVADSMTISVSLFEAHLKYLRDNGYQVIPLRQLIEHRLHGGSDLPARAVVITADDGHRSVYTDMLSLIRFERLPVTLFIYPSAISNADYAMTWEQLSELKQTGFFDIQSHSFWHPNFTEEKRRLTHDAYDKFVRAQLVRSKDTLEKKLQGQVDMLAWPFGIFDDELINIARESGYHAGFTIEGRPATPADSIMALPRYLVTQSFQLKLFAEIVGGNAVQVNKGY
ncbi:MAG TPA: polysaccharide deacetylase family protein [Acidobacteriota bacterium]|nr:polysaccharide deacetylase family protein [Acidobacteriota bacterium]